MFTGRSLKFTGTRFCANVYRTQPQVYRTQPQGLPDAASGKTPAGDPFFLFWNGEAARRKDRDFGTRKSNLLGLRAFQWGGSGSCDHRSGKLVRIAFSRLTIALMDKT